MKTHIDTPGFNALRALHQENPAAYEALRRQLLNDAVMAAPASRRVALQRMLHRIEASRQAATTPLEAAVAAFRLMDESWCQLQEAWGHLQQEVATLQAIVVLERAKNRGVEGRPV